MTLTYLDNNATTQPLPEVLSAMLPYLTEYYGNPSSLHRFGQRARQAVDESRQQLATLLGSSPTEITFTGGGTEAVNTALRSLLATRSPRRHVVTTTVEHSATRELLHSLAKEKLVDLTEIPVDLQGHLDLDSLRSSLTPDTSFFTCLHANNETGVLFPIPEISAMCRSASVPFHCDSTQAVGKIKVDVVALGVDLLTCAAHKFHGPKGVGALFTRRGSRLKPLILGGPQERDKRGGTENVPGIVGMGAAASLASSHLLDLATRVASLRDHLESQILSSIPDTSINGDPHLRVPNTTNIAFSRLEAEAILLLLSEQGICASAGAACSSGSLEPSPILKAMKIPDRQAHGSIRFSLSHLTTPDDISRTLTLLPPLITRLHSVLPVGAQ